MPPPPSARAARGASTVLRAPRPPAISRSGRVSGRISKRIVAQVFVIRPVRDVAFLGARLLLPRRIRVSFGAGGDADRAQSLKKLRKVPHDERVLLRHRRHRQGHGRFHGVDAARLADRLLSLAA